MFLADKEKQEVHLSEYIGKCLMLFDLWYILTEKFFHQIVLQSIKKEMHQLKAFRKVGMRGKIKQADPAC